MRNITAILLAIFISSCGPSKEEWEKMQSEKPIEKQQDFKIKSITVNGKLYVVVYNNNGIAISN